MKPVKFYCIWNQWCTAIYSAGYRLPSKQLNSFINYRHTNMQKARQGLTAALTWPGTEQPRRCLRLSSSSGAEGPPAPTAQLHGEQPHGAPGSPQNTPPWSSLWLRKLQQLLSYLRAFFSGSASTDSGLLICGTSILNIMGCVIDLAIADALQAWRLESRETGRVTLMGAGAGLAGSGEQFRW